MANITSEGLIAVHASGSKDLKRSLRNWPPMAIHQSPGAVIIVFYGRTDAARLVVRVSLRCYGGA